MTVTTASRADEYDALLSDGRLVHLRPPTPEDRDALLALNERLSDRTSYLRWFGVSRIAGTRYVDRLLRPDDGQHAGVVAFVGGLLAAVASYEAIGDGDADVAFLVDDAHQSTGIGTLMLEHLAAVAVRQGVHRFVAETLPDNSRMQEVFRRAGFDARLRFADGEVFVEFPIQPTDRLLDALDERERLADARSVAHLLAPASIAVVGGGHPGAVGHDIVRNLLAGRYSGALYPVHRDGRDVCGLTAYASVADLPEPAELAVVAVPAADVLDVVRACAARGVHNLVVVSAGFAETGPDGAALEREVLHVAREAGMRLVGPNCLGLVNTAPDVRMNATFAEVRPRPGPVGVLSQSGAVGIALLEQLAARGLGVSAFVSVGNKADVSGNDLLLHWEDDERTRVVVLYLESFGNPRKFARIARRVAANKPVIAVKSGRTWSGHRAARSHTAATLSSDVAVDALFRQTGVIRVNTTEELLHVATLLVAAPLPRGRRVAIVSNAGGPATLTADACEGAGLAVGELGARTQARLRQLLPAGAAVANPVDVLASATPEEFAAALDAVLDDEAVDAVVAVHTMVRGRPTADVAEAVRRTAADHPDKPVLATFPGCSDVPALTRDDGAPALPCFAFPETAVHALKHVARYAEWRARPRGERPKLEGVDVDRARALVEEELRLRPGGGWLDTRTAARLLRAYAVELAPTVRADGAEQAVQAAEAVGYPVALKAASRDVLHKSDEGGVRLHLATGDEVREAYAAVHAALGERMGGVLVQPMARAGVETIVGVAQDPLFGPLVMFGLGGTSTELLGDRVYRILPLTDVDAAELVRSLRSSPLLFGYRGSEPVAVGALEDLLARVARLAEDLPEVAELEFNPVLVSSHGAVPVDVRVRVRPAPPESSLQLRRLRT